MQRRPTNVPERELTSIQFSLISPQVLRKWSCESVVNFGSLNKDVPERGSICSPLLGAWDRNSICGDCNLSPCNCNEEFSVLELPYPVIHQWFINSIVDVLRCVCVFCGELLINKKNDRLMQLILEEKNPLTRRKLIVKLSKDIVYCSNEKHSRKKKKKDKKINTDEDEKDDEDETDEQQYPLCHPTQEENQLLLSENREALLKSCKEQKRCHQVHFQFKVKNIFEIVCQPKDTTEDGKFIKAKNKFYSLSPARLQNLLLSLSDEDVILLGYSPTLSHPGWLFLENFPCSPASSRIVFGNDKNRNASPFTKKFDDITKCVRKLHDLRVKHIKDKRTSQFVLDTTNNTTTLKLNNGRLEVIDVKSAHRSRDASIDDVEWGDFLSDDLWDTSTEFRELFDNVQYLVSSYLKADLPPPKHHRKHEIRLAATNTQNIQDKFDGKDKMIRGQNLAKRVNYVARSVITGSGHSDINHLLTPICVAKTVTTMEIIDQYNIQRLRQCVKNGPLHHPGANYIEIDKDTIELEDRDYRDEFFVKYVRDSKETSQKIDLSRLDCYRFADCYLRIGMKVHRHLVDGEIVCVNRQPSLHKHSFMSCVVKLVLGYTFGLPLSICVALNADFDGDCGVFHIPQITSSVVESTRLLSVRNNQLTSQSSQTIIGPIQDTILGSALVTHPNIILTYDDFVRFISEAHFLPIQEFGKHWFPYYTHYIPSPQTVHVSVTGRQLFSQLLPKCFNYGQDRRYFDAQRELILPTDKSIFDHIQTFHQTVPWKQPVIVINQHLVSGIVTSKHLGKSGTAIIHQIIHEHGAERCRRFQSDLQRVIGIWLSEYGFSIGINDCRLSTPEATAEIKNLIDIGLEGIRNHPLLQSAVQLMKPQFSPIFHTNDMVACATSRPLLSDSSHSNKQYVDLQYQYINVVEKMLLSILNQLSIFISKLVQQQIEGVNNIGKMVGFGSKGKDSNSTQIIALIGQQETYGKRVKNDERIPMHYFRQHNKHKILQLIEQFPQLKSVFAPYLDTLMARGYIVHPYGSTGLNAHEYYNHSMSGREGIIHANLSTEVVGYFQRRMVKAMENIMTYYDLSVRDVSGNVLQKLFGRDGFARDKLCRFHFPFCRMTDVELECEYAYVQSDLPMWKYHETDSIYNPTQQDTDLERAELTMLQNYRDKLAYYQSYYPKFNINEMIVVPVNIELVITQALQYQRLFNENDALEELTPYLILCYTKSCMERLYRYYPNAHFNRLWKFEAHLFTSLSVKRVLFVHQLNRVGFEFALAEINVRFVEALKNHNEAVGVDTGQILGQIRTQQALNEGKNIDKNIRISSSAAATNDSMLDWQFSDENQIPQNVNLIEMYTDVSKKPKILIMKVYPISFEQLLEYYGHNQSLMQEELQLSSNDEEGIAHYLSRTLVEYYLYELCLLQPTVVSIDDDDNDNYWLKSLLKFTLGKDLELWNEFQIRHVPFVMRYTLNVDLMEYLQVEMEDIIVKMRKFVREQYYHDDNSNLHSIWGTKRSKELTFLYSPITYTNDGKRYRILRVYVSPLCDRYKQITKHKQIMNHPLKTVQAMMNSWYQKTLVVGVEDIKSASVSIESYQHWDPTTKRLSTLKRHVVTTQGSNVAEVLANPLVNDRYTHTSCLWRTNNVWGIHVSRNLQNLNLQRAVDATGEYVDSSHPDLVTSAVLHVGYFVPFRRHGMNNVKDYGPTKRMTFEQPLNTFVHAATTAEHDPLLGPTEQCLTGKLTNLGTGSVQIGPSISTTICNDSSDDEEEVDVEEQERLEREQRRIRPKAIPFYSEVDQETFFTKPVLLHDIWSTIPSTSIVTVQTPTSTTTSTVHHKNSSLIEQMESNRKRTQLHYQTKTIINNKSENAIVPRTTKSSTIILLSSIMSEYPKMRNRKLNSKFQWTSTWYATPTTNLNEKRNNKRKPKINMKTSRRLQFSLFRPINS